jgi:hypothetical protein
MLDSVLDYIQFLGVSVKQAVKNIEYKNASSLGREELMRFFSSVGVRLSAYQINRFMNFVDKNYELT